MFMTKAIACIVLLITLLVPYSADAFTTPPAESDWQNNKDSREDLRPLEVSGLTSSTTIDGIISSGEWAGATVYESRDPFTNDLLGTLSFGMSGSTLQMANDWIINPYPDPADGGSNAWRIGTSDRQGPQYSGNSTWYEIYVQENGVDDIVRVREAADQAGLQYATFVDGSEYGINAGSNFNGSNWQYELSVGPNIPLPVSYHWEWQVIDPICMIPGECYWAPVYDGTVHTPEPVSSVLFIVGGAALGFRRFRKTITPTDLLK